MRVVITGATGFIGRSLTRRALTEGHDVHVVHRAGSSSSNLLDDHRDAGAQVHLYEAYADLRGQVETSAPDAVFHLATHYTKSHHSREIESMIDANVQMGTHLLESLRGSPASIVSTISYFQFRQGQPIGNSLYSATKQAFSEVSRYYRDVEGADIREVVLFDTYGAGDTRPKLLPLLVSSARSGEQVRLGAASQLVNLLYIDDVVSGLLAAALPGSASVTALKAPREVSVRELVESVQRISGTPFPCAFRPDAEPNPHVLKAGTWPAPTGWEPVVGLDEGLRRTLRPGSDS